MLKRLPGWRLILLLLLLSSLSATGRAQRDHLTEQETDLVREEQALDRRTAIFIKAIERRLLVISDPQAAVSKQAKKDAEKWGELPKGTRAELLWDIAKILDEAIVNIDDTAARNPQSPLLPKALHNLADASTRFLGQLTPLRDSAQGREREALEQAIENAQSIIEAAKKVPPPAKK
jgi:hypothetical protein